MVTKKVSKPALSRREPSRAPTAVSRQRPRSHALAPEHVGEVGSVALLAIAVLGVALFIAGIAVLIFGVTAGNRYAGATPPPNVGSLGLGQIVGGGAVSLLSVLLVGFALAVFAEVRWARIVSAALSGLTAILAAAGVVLIMSRAGGDQIFAAALAVVALIFAAAAIVLARQRR